MSYQAKRVEPFADGVFVCAWCDGVMRSSTHDTARWDSNNFGICGSCRSTQLRLHLQQARSRKESKSAHLAEPPRESVDSSLT